MEEVKDSCQILNYDFCYKKCFMGWESWSSGYGRRLLCKKTWVRIPALDELLGTIIGEKITMLFERTANIQKEARNGPFLKYRFFDLPNLIFGVVVLIGSRKIIDVVDDEMKKKKTEERNCGSSVTKNQTGERERERENICTRFRKRHSSAGKQVNWMRKWDFEKELGIVSYVLRVCVSSVLQQIGRCLLSSVTRFSEFSPLWFIFEVFCNYLSVLFSI